MKKMLKSAKVMKGTMTFEALEVGFAEMIF